MKKLTLILLVLVDSYILMAQASSVVIEKKEYKIQEEGYVTFSVLKDNPQLPFKPDKEYYWFNNFSGIQSTKGGAGGQLLHGKLQQFYSNGMLSIEMNLAFGLKNGMVKNWDKEGILTSDSKYQNDVIIYTKFKNEEGKYIEWIGEMFKNGSVKNVYGEDGKQLLQKDQLIEDAKAIMTSYYSYPIGAVHTTYVGSILGTLKYGYYRAYYKNGQISIDGNYENTNRVGTWMYYDEFGALTSKENYRIHKEYYPNGKIKIEGGEFLSPASKSWVKNGYWWLYNPDGDSDVKIYNMGAETNEIKNY